MFYSAPILEDRIHETRQSFLRQVQQRCKASGAWLALPASYAAPGELRVDRVLQRLPDGAGQTLAAGFHQSGARAQLRPEQGGASAFPALDPLLEDAYWAALPVMLDGWPPALLCLARQEPFSAPELEELAGRDLPTLAGLLENQLLRRSLASYQAKMETLHSVSLRISATLELQEVLDLVLEATMQLIPANATHIFLCDTLEPEPDFHFGAALWSDGRHTPAVTRPRPDGLTAITARTGRPLIIENARRHPLYAEPIASAWGVEAIAGFPIRRGERTLGVFTVSFLAPHHFTPEERNLLSLFADRVAVSIENARANQAISQQLTDLRLLYMLAQKTGASLDLDQVLETVVTALKEFLQPYAVSLMLLGEDQSLNLVASAGPRELLNKRASLKPGQGVGGQVIQSRRPLCVPNVYTHPGYILIDPNVRSLLVVPMLINGQPIGTLSLDSDRENAFTLDTERLLTIAAAQAAIAIENARLYQDEHRRAGELNSIMELGHTITQSLDLSKIFYAAYQSIHSLVPGDAFFMSLVSRHDPNFNEIYLIEKGVQYPIVRWESSAGLSGWVIRTGRPLLLRDMINEPLPVDPVDYGADDDVHSMIGAPLRFASKVTGMVGLQSYQQHAYNEHDLALFQSIADHLAIAIEHANLYADLEKRLVSLQELDRLRHEFTQNVSHELRTPLTYLRSYIDLLIEGEFGELSERQRQSLAIVQSKTNLLVRLVEDIATLETSGKDWLQIQEIDLVESARESVVLAGQLAAGRQMTIDLIAPDDLPSVSADPHRLGQVFDNLLNNAIKFGIHGDHIEVRISPADGEARVCVFNAGSSISPAEHERIFERFYQINAPLSRRQGGLGLGLSIVKNIVEGHGGRIWIESQPGQGAAIYFTLPLASAPTL